MLQTNILITTEQLSKAINLSEETIRQMARNGDIPAAKLKREWRFDLDKVKTALEDFNG